MNTSNVLDEQGNFKTNVTYRYETVKKINSNHGNEWVSYFKDAYVHERAKNQLQGLNGNYNQRKDQENMNGLKSIMGITDVRTAPDGTGGTGMPNGESISNKDHEQLLDRITNLNNTIEDLRKQINAHESQIKALEKSDKDKGQKIEALEQQIENLQEQIKQKEEAFWADQARQDEKLSELEVQLQDLEDRLNNLLGNNPVPAVPVNKIENKTLQMLRL